MLASIALPFDPRLACRFKVMETRLLSAKLRSIFLKLNIRIVFRCADIAFVTMLGERQDRASQPVCVC